MCIVLLPTYVLNFDPFSKLEKKYSFFFWKPPIYLAILIVVGQNHSGLNLNLAVNGVVVFNDEGGEVEVVG